MVCGTLFFIFVTLFLFHVLLFATLQAATAPVVWICTASWRSDSFDFAPLVGAAVCPSPSSKSPIPVFQETKRPSKEMQVTIARQLGLEPTTVGNFFMNARRRSHDKWREGPDGGSYDGDDLDDHEDDDDSNIKYEVYDCGDGMDGNGGAYQDPYDPHMTSLGEETVSSAYHHNNVMTAIPAPVHNPHNQLQSYPSSCA